MKNPYIKQVNGYGLKGAGFSYDLNRLTVLRGPNFSGKTRIIQAVRFALLGCIPEISKKPGDAIALCDGPKMITEVNFASGEQIHRELTRSAGKVSYSFNASGLTNEQLAELADMPLLNQSHYFQLGASKRTEYLFSRLQLEDYSFDKIKTRLQRVCAEAGTGDAHLKATEKYIGEFTGYFPPNGSVPEGVSGALASLSASLTATKKRVSETVGAVRTLSDLKTRESFVSATTREDLGKEDAEVLKAQSEVGAQISLLNTQLENSQRNAEKAQRVRTQLATIETEEVLQRRIQQTEAKIAELRAELPDKSALPDLNVIVEEGRKARTTHEAAKLAVLANRGQLANAKDDLNQWAAKINEFESLECCPTCKAKARGWKSEVLKEWQASKAAAEELVKRLESQLKSRMIAESEAAEACSAVETRYRSGKAQQESYTSRESALERAERELRALNAGLENATKLRSSLTEQLQQLGTLTNEQCAEIEEKRKQATERAEGLRQKRFDIQKRFEDITRLEQDLKRAAQASNEHQALKSEAEVLTALTKELKKVQGEMIEASYGAVLTVANRVTSGILKSPLVFQDGEVGRLHAGSFIPYYAFSGTEESLTFAGNAAGLSARAPFKLLIFDEIGRMDKENVLQLLANIDQCIEEGILDQAIVAGIHDGALGQLENVGLSTLSIIDVR